MQNSNNSRRALTAADDKPGWGLSLILGITHVSLIFDGIIFLPNMIGKATDIPAGQVAFVTFATLIVAALGTFFQAVRIGRVGCGFVLFIGSYSAFLACTLMAVEMGGLELMATMTLLSAPVVLFYSYFLRFLRHIVTPPVGGVLIILVALSLMPIAIELWQGGGPSMPYYGSYRNYIVGVITMGILVTLMLFGNNALRLWTPIIGIGAGCLAAFFFDLFTLEHFSNAPLFGLPQGQWPGLTLDLNWSHIPLLGAFVMAALVSSMEGTGNIMLLHQISLKDFRKVDYSRVQGGLYCDGLSKGLSGLLGGTPVATFCDNIPLLKITRVASTRVGIMGGSILICLAFMPKISGFLLDIPHAVIGGMLVLVCAMLFYAGLGLVMRSGLTFQMGLVLGLSLCAGLVAETRNFFPDIMPVNLSPILQNGVAMGGFVAIFLSTLLYLFPKPGIVFQLQPRQDRMLELMNRLESLKIRLSLDDSTFNRLRLSCEETFSHLIEFAGNSDKKCLFEIRLWEEGIFVEIIFGDEVEEVDQGIRPFNAVSASSEELSRLGLLLLAKTARDVQHIHISGYTYISFIIDA
jgi:xanthine/uracil permease